MGFTETYDEVVEREEFGIEVVDIHQGRRFSAGTYKGSVGKIKKDRIAQRMSWQKAKKPLAGYIRRGIEKTLGICQHICFDLV